MITDPVTYVTYTLLWLVLLTVLVIVFRERLTDKNKKAIFLIMVLPILLAALYLAGHTVYKNVQSPTNGPVHWHMDYQVWVCDERLNLVDPNFPKNKIGTPLLHEHNDDRIHLEGTPLSLDEASIGHFFETIGGHLTSDSFSYDSVDGPVTVTNGDACGDEPGTLKVYVNGVRMDDPASYIYYPDPLVPSGDCAIILFDSSDEPTTDKLCESWAVNDWTYDNYERPTVTIGGHTWQ